MTGHWASEFAKEIKKLKIDRVLQKPFAIKEVRRVADELLPHES